MKRILAAVSGLVFLFVGSVLLRSQETAPVFEPPEIIATAEAVYPANAVNWGTVVLRVTIGAKGEIEDVKVVRSFPGFDEQALSSIQQWKFRPARLDGKPIRSAIPVAFSFSQPRAWWFGTRQQQ